MATEKKVLIILSQADWLQSFLHVNYSPRQEPWGWSGEKERELKRSPVMILSQVSEAFWQQNLQVMNSQIKCELGTTQLAQCLTDEQMVFGVSKSVIFNSDWGSTLRPSGAPFGQGLLSLRGGVFPLLGTRSYLSAENKHYLFLLDPYLWRWVHFQAKASVLCCGFMDELGERGSHEAPDKVCSFGVYTFPGKKIAALTCSLKQPRLKRSRVTFTLLLYLTAGWELKGGIT